MNETVVPLHQWTHKGDRADPEIVVEIDDGDGVKCKAAGECLVVYYGDWAGALAFTMEGRLAWLDAVARSSGAASNSGDSGAAITTGECSTVESSGLGSIAVSTATRFTWIVRPGAVLAMRWVADQAAHHKMLVADELNLADGQMVFIQNGEIVKEWTW